MTTKLPHTELLIKNLQGLVEFHTKWPDAPLHQLDLELIKKALQVFEQMRATITGA